jgi:rhodanese-related sulfurtransferase
MSIQQFRRAWAKAALAALTVAAFLAAPAFAQQEKDLTVQDMVAAANKIVASVTAAQAKSELNVSGVVFLDVREPAEFSKGHIPGAVNIPRGLLEFSITNEVPVKSTRLVVYCKVGGRGALAGETLMKMGYKNLVNMKGGWEEWLAAGFPAQ